MKKIYISVFAALAALLFVSCEKDFELLRPNQEPYQSIRELELAAQSPYLYITERPWANALGMMALSGFGESDISFYTGATGDSYCQEYDKRSFSNLKLNNAKELEGAFIYLYAMSSATNKALQLYDKAEKEGRDLFPLMSDDDKKKAKELKGEFLFERALAYWYIVRKWAPPYNDINKNGKYFVEWRYFENDPEIIKNAPLAKLGDVYTHIVSDLENAILLLPDDYPSDQGSARMRANKNVAKSLLARILFYMGAENNKTQIESLLDDIIDGGDYDLSEEPYAAFNKMGEQYGKETIWQICYSSSTERFDRNPGIFNVYAYNTKANSTSGYIAFAMGYSALCQMGWMKPDPNAQGMVKFSLTDDASKDKRFQQLYKFQTSYSSVPINIVFLWKYFRGTKQTDAAQRRANRPLIRLADLLLMRAQIRLMTGDAHGATDDLNTVRERAGLEQVQLATDSLIEIERIKEMAGENADRINWLVGLGKDIPIGDRDASKYQAIKYPYSDMYYQVPVIEMQANRSYSFPNEEEED